MSALVTSAFLVALIPVASASAAGTNRYVSPPPAGSDAGNTSCSSASPCATVQHAVDVASAGDTVRIAKGTYVEQVSIAKNLTLVGAGIDSTKIKGPDVKSFVDTANPVTYIVKTTGPVSVQVTDLTVLGPSGPGGALDCAPNPLSLDIGVAVLNGSTLNMWHAAVRNIFDVDASNNKNSGCQRGDAISVGRPGGLPSPTVGHANVADVQVSNYQKDGVAVRSAGSSLNLLSSQVTNLPSTIIASNGVEVLDGATARVLGNSVSGNECDLQPGVVCGPDPINDTESAGILSSGAATSTRIADNNVFGNDMGIYTDDGITINGNQDSRNRAAGIYVDTDATKLHVTHNTTNADGFYGIVIGPCVTAFGCTKGPNPGGNFFVENTAFNNTRADLYQSADEVVPNFNQDNHCGTAFPSRRYWDCENGQETNGRAVADGPGGEGQQHDGVPHHTPASTHD